MITPVNGHLIIEPVKQESFIQSGNDRYEEIGIVVETEFYDSTSVTTKRIYPQKGDKVYFDSYLAAKYPKGDGEFYWLVNWSDVRAVDYAE